MPINLKFLSFLHLTDRCGNHGCGKEIAVMEEPAFSSRGISTLVLNGTWFMCVYTAWHNYMYFKRNLYILINLHTSQGKHRGTDASCSSQGSTTIAVGENSSWGFTGNMNMWVTTSVYCTQGCRQMDETTHSESSTVVSSIGHLEHVRISESLVLSYCLTIPL